METPPSDPAPHPSREQARDGAAESAAPATVLFADVADSSGLYDRLRPDVARETLERALDLMDAVVRREGGVVRKRIGDELMCTFADAANALHVADALQIEVEQAVASGSLPGLSIRIGLHHGEVVERSGELFGPTIHVAQRLTTLAKAGQIVVARETLEGVEPATRPPVRFLEQTNVRGRPGLFEVFEVEWGTAATLQVTPAPASLGAVPPLEVEYDGRTFVLDASRPRVEIGRQPPCDIVVGHETVSRLHARIELRKRRYYLVDLSTNGTRVVFERAPAVELRRDEVALADRGHLVLGLGEPEAARYPVRFRVTIP